MLLVNLALGLGVLLGFLAWGRQVPRLVRDLEQARQAAGSGVERTWTVRGVVRAVFPEADVLIITHEDIPGFMQSMTMGFRVAEPRLHQGLDIGDTIRFTLRGVPPNLLITEIAREGKS
jgi:Cu(I)/Ag(I) efflux system membrane protein CusA/SilA